MVGASRIFQLFRLADVAEADVAARVASVAGRAALAARGQLDGELDAMGQELYRVLCHFETVRTDLKLDDGHVVRVMVRWLAG